MRITRVTLNFTETCNLGDYSNTKPSIELTADVEPGDDVQAVIGQLSDIAKGSLHTKIDEELEMVGRPPKYYDGLLFDVIEGNEDFPYVAIVPNKLTYDFSGYRRFHVRRQCRYPIALAQAQERVQHSDYAYFDCRDGDLTNLLDFLSVKKIACDQAREEQRKKEEERRREWLERERRVQAEQEQEEDFDEEDDEESDDDE